jgi:hypothetical protein
MDHLLAADALMGEQAALPVATGGSYANMATNIFYFSARVVDKLWQGAYIRDANEVFYFISKLISQAKRKCKCFLVIGMNIFIVYCLYYLSNNSFQILNPFPSHSKWTRIAGVPTFFQPNSSK